ncbi:hypothetical protein NIES4072_11970 [Nostoc commune NIES-4072]|uniref:Uncharacterized protein n=1 Tax=Nostoc commune NIES-4072 TaxID=2005467 RepID=A0A2R5FG38_NOSCO|nr:hypothetical protein [Nostoc commune]BBD65138.1 hypothetical protein NIES4070_14850 [Nostoc commune HK-02]GBG17537.1 hypothetical protein NIES4072_11970 [Nostoc commune NIES-4072]
MYNRVNFWGSIFYAFLFYTGLTFNIPIANAQLKLNPSLLRTISVIKATVPVSEVPCSTFLQPYFDWERGSFLNFVTASVVFNNAGKNPVTYTTGTLNLNGNNLTGDLTQLLSNRFIRLPGDGPFSFSSQPFAINQPASIGITLAPDGSVTWVERSNNTSFDYKAVCYSNDTAILLPLFSADSSAGVITFGKGTGPK